jgi:hypothetical protein
VTVAADLEGGGGAGAGRRAGLCAMRAERVVTEARAVSYIGSEAVRWYAKTTAAAGKHPRLPAMRNQQRSPAGLEAHNRRDGRAGDRPSQMFLLESTEASGRRERARWRGVRWFVGPVASSAAIW